MARINVGNTTITGFVNLSQDGRLVIGTGSYLNKNNEKVFKESVTVFLDEKFDGEVPAKGDYVRVSADLQVGPRKDQPEQLNATMNIRFKNQLVKAEPPKKAESAPADEEAI